MGNPWGRLTIRLWLRARRRRPPRGEHRPPAVVAGELLGVGQRGLGGAAGSASSTRGSRSGRCRPAPLVKVEPDRGGVLGALTDHPRALGGRPPGRPAAGWLTSPVFPTSGPGRLAGPGRARGGAGRPRPPP